MSADDRLFYVQIMIDSVNIYNTYKYDKDYGKLKVIVSKFLSYPPLDISSSPFSSNPEVGTTDVKVDEGKTFIFPIAAKKIEPVLGSAFVDFQVLLESDSEEKVKAGIHNLQVGYTRIYLKDEMKAMIDAVYSVQSDRPEIKELEGAYVIRQGDLQAGTIFLGIRFTMFGSSVSSSITSGSASVIDSSPPQIAERKVSNTVSNDPQMIAQSTLEQSKEKWYSLDNMQSGKDQPSKGHLKDQLGEKQNQYNAKNEQQIGKNQSTMPSLKGQELNRHDQDTEPFDTLKQNMQALKNQLEILKKDNQKPSQLGSQTLTKNQATKTQKPKDVDDVRRAYTYIYSELNGQVIDMKIAHESKMPRPKMGDKCL